jgi:hypothetical protein
MFGPINLMVQIHGFPFVDALLILCAPMDLSDPHRELRIRFRNVARLAAFSPAMLASLTG